MFLSTVYLPPDSKVIICSALEESLDRLRLHVRPQDAVVIFGDFNMSEVCWSADSGLNFVKCNNIPSVCGMSSRLLEVFRSNELSQHNSLPT